MILRWLVSALALFIVGKLGLGIRVDTFTALILGAIVLGLANLIVRPVLLILTLPLNLMTLGLFTLVVNGIIFLLVAYIVPGFHVNGFFGAIIGALATGIIAAILGFVIRIL